MLTLSITPCHLLSRLTYYPSLDQFQDIINRPQSIIVYFFDESNGPSPEFEFLMNDDHPAVDQIETFIVDVNNTPIERYSSQLPLTVLYKEGEEVDVADAGDLDKFFELCERARDDN